MKSKAIKWLGTLLGCLSLVVVVSAIAGPVNDKYPLSGNAVKKEATYSVGFCCGNCQGKFTKNPSASIAKVKAAPIPRTVARSLLTCGDVAVTATPTVIASAHVIIDGDPRQTTHTVGTVSTRHRHKANQCATRVVCVRGATARGLHARPVHARIASTLVHVHLA